MFFWAEGEINFITKLGKGGVQIDTKFKVAQNKVTKLTIVVEVLVD